MPIFRSAWKIDFFENWSKSGPGSVLVRFGLQNRFLHEKLYRLIGSDQFFMNFWKSGLLAGQQNAGLSAYPYIHIYLYLKIRTGPPGLLCHGTPWRPHFQKFIKNWSEPIILYSFSCRIRFWNPNWPKTNLEPHFDQFSEKLIYHAGRNMGMKPPKFWDLSTPAWGSKAALKKLSFTWFPTHFDGFKIQFWADLFI